MTHFTILIRTETDSLSGIGEEIARMLAPFDENKEVTAYKRRLKSSDVKMACKYFKLPNLNACALTSDQIKEYFGGEGGGKDAKGYYYMSTYNPKSKWDWYTIGGRWQGMLTLKAGTVGRYVKMPNIDKRDLSIIEQLKKTTGEDSVDVDIAFLKDVDFDGMRAKEIAQVTEDYYKAVDWLVEELEKGRTIDECAAALYYEYGVEDESLDEKLARTRNFSTHAVVDKDGWHEWSKMGWWGTHHSETMTEADWNRDFAKNFLSNATDKTAIAVVDAHI